MKEARDSDDDRAVCPALPKQPAATKTTTKAKRTPRRKDPADCGDEGAAADASYVVEEVLAKIQCELESELDAVRGSSGNDHSSTSRASAFDSSGPSAPGDDAVAHDIGAAPDPRMCLRLQTKHPRDKEGLGSLQKPGFPSQSAVGDL